MPEFPSFPDTAACFQKQDLSSAKIVRKIFWELKLQRERGRGIVRDNFGVFAEPVK